MLKNKKENAINLGIAVGTGKEVLIQGSIYRIVKFNVDYFIAMETDH